MKKIAISLNINEYKIKTKGNIDNEIISFKDKDGYKTKITYDLKNCILTRENDIILSKMSFKEKENNLEYYLKEQKTRLTDTFKVEKIEKKKNNIKIIYEISNNKFDLSLNYEEVK